MFCRQEVLSEADKPAEPVEYKSITQKDFNIDTFTPTKPAPTAVRVNTLYVKMINWTFQKITLNNIIFI